MEKIQEQHSIEENIEDSTVLFYDMKIWETIVRKNVKQAVSFLQIKSNTVEHLKWNEVHERHLGNGQQLKVIVSWGLVKFQ